jgi:hypothetical protein
MPKRARQAHIPKQVTRKRKARREGGVVTGADAYLDVSGPINTAGIATGPVAPIPLPRPASSPARERSVPRVQAPRPGTYRASGQLPTFERSYLVEELRRIAITAGGLLTLIIVLTFVLR